MNNYQDIIQQLTTQLGGGQMQPPQPPRDLNATRQWLKTAPGRNATRGAIDKMIMNHKTGVRIPGMPTHQEILDVLDMARGGMPGG